MNPFIARMVDDMKIRNFADTTIDAYTWHVDKFCQHFGKPADELGPEEIRSFQLYLVDVKKASWSSFNQAVCGLRFLYNVTLARNWTVQHIPYGKRPKKLPMVLSDQEAAKLLECVEHLKHRAVLTICYAAGLRLSEATHLKVADIDGQRAQIRINEGKGRKDRFVPASPKLLEELREYWKKYRPKDYLFPGKTSDVPLSSATIQKACKMAAAFAGISKVISPHVLRHSYATGMLEAGVDVLTISKLLGHSSFITTMIYLHVRRQHFDRSPSPLDWLPTRQCPQWAERREPTQPMEGRLLPTLPATTPPPTPAELAALAQHRLKEFRVADHVPELFEAGIDPKPEPPAKPPRTKIIGSKPIRTKPTRRTTKRRRRRD